MTKKIKYLISETLNKRILHFLLDVLKHQFKVFYKKYNKYLILFLNHLKEDYSKNIDFVNFSSNLSIEDKEELLKYEEIRKKSIIDLIPEEPEKEISIIEKINLINVKSNNKKNIVIYFILFTIY